MPRTWNFIHESLQEQATQGKYRKLKVIEAGQAGSISIAGSHRLNLSSNDYLQLASDRQVQKVAESYLQQYGTGSTASRLISGTWSYHQELEEKLSHWLAKESVSLFNSGYQLNCSLIPAISNRDTHLYFDKLNHNSLVQGAILSRAKLHRYRHLDYQHLEQILKQESAETRKIIVTESVFSMDGDVADITRLVDIAKRYNAMLIVDEAHAIGVMGDEGRGLACQHDDVDMVIGTFGKAFGSFGAYIACSNELREYLINFCSGFIYTTALPPAVIGATIGALERIQSMQNERAYLAGLGIWFRGELKHLGLDYLNSSSHIIPIIIGSEQDTMRISQHLSDHGFMCQAIRPPTVESGKSRLRVTLNSAITKEHLTKFLQVIQKAVSSDHDTFQG